MTSVTDLNINMHPRLVKKLDIMIERMERKGFDNFLIIDGKEGLGKTTLASELCYYVYSQTGRRFNHDDIYFRVTNLLNQMKESSGKIFLLDEAELDLLSEQRGKIQRYFMQMLMAARKKNHFIIAIIPTIKKLKSFVVDRAIGLIRVYSPNNLDRGYYAYYNEKSKNRLYENWQRTRRLEYKKFYSFVGTFPDKFSLIINEEEYDKKKDKAIQSIGEEEKQTKTMKEYNKLKYKLHQLLINKKLGVTLTKFSEMMGKDHSVISKWGKIPEKNPYVLEEDE